MQRLANHWDVILSLAIGVVAALFLAPDRWAVAVAEIVAFFAIQSAAAYFAMTITASGVRPEALSIDDVNRYDAALKELMLFWKVFLGLNVAAAAGLATVKLIGWPNATWSAMADTFGWQHAFSGFLATLSALALFRTIGFFHDVAVLMRINRELAERVVKTRDAAQADAFQAAAREQPFATPEGFGKRV